MINAYTFGKMMINGRPYTEDVIVLPDGRVISPWWRNAGHVLSFSDIKEIVAAKPEILVVGTGSYGMMKPAFDLSHDLQEQGIQLIVCPTGQAVDIFNTLKQTSEVIGGCFHLTC